MSLKLVFRVLKHWNTIVWTYDNGNLTMATSRDTTRHGTWFPLQSTSWNVSANCLPASDVASCCTHSIHNVGPHSTQNCQPIKWGSPIFWIMPIHANPWSKRCIVMAAIVIPPSLGIPRNRYAHLRINWWHPQSMAIQSITDGWYEKSPTICGLSLYPPVIKGGKTSHLLRWFSHMFPYLPMV